MEKIIINGPNELYGKIEVHSSKNSILPILSASILAEGKVILKNCPKITDIENMLKILDSLGCEVSFIDGTITIDGQNASKCNISAELSKNLRSSIFMLGSILSRFKYAKIAYPGGCDIGKRPIDLHILGLKKLNAKIIENFDGIECIGENLKGNLVDLSFPSVGATENIMLAAVKAKGDTTILNAASEPEIVDLQNFLNKMGAKISGAGTKKISIVGVAELKGVEYSPISDRIVAGTLLIATAMCGGEVVLNNFNCRHLESLVSILRKSACKVKCKNDKIYIQSKKKLNFLSKIITAPYPGFPTDLQAQIVAAMAVANGVSEVKETIFETRFKYIDELKKMGADITVNGNTATINGVRQLTGAKVFAKDLRGGAALILAGLAAFSKTEVFDIYHIDRGYESIEKMLHRLGADIVRGKIEE
ncbi:MAG: UDP-N-acetylglucosamine 1-carboxyvinyltransferase [Firmicutes bacterium]|nr:UDP-N-acetylglucosamine 1-carboxyvinyltransferase [Bacillota bacterium]